MNFTIKNYVFSVLTDMSANFQTTNYDGLLGLGFSGGL